MLSFWCFYKPFDWMFSLQPLYKNIQFILIDRWPFLQTWQWALTEQEYVSPMKAILNFSCTSKSLSRNEYLHWISHAAQKLKIEIAVMSYKDMFHNIPLTPQCLCPAHAHRQYASTLCTPQLLLPFKLSYYCVQCTYAWTSLYRIYGSLISDDKQITE